MTVTELRDEELMQMLIDEEIVNIKATYGDKRLGIAVSYFYTRLGEVPFEEMDEWMQESASEWETMLKPYVPFGLTYQYDWDIDEYRMYFNGKEVRAIYDTVQCLFISTHSGIGEGIYANDVVDLYVEYDGRKITGLREAAQQEMKDADEKRLAETDAYKNGHEKYFDRLRENVPATKEDYQSLFALKTPDYRSKSVAKFNEELLEWTNHNFERKERIAIDNMYGDYRVALTVEEKKFRQQQHIYQDWRTRRMSGVFRKTSRNKMLLRMFFCRAKRSMTRAEIIVFGVPCTMLFPIIYLTRKRSA